MTVLDPGHQYKLGTLDGDIEMVLTFVKRNNPPERYPGNLDSYPGTTLQEVIRASLNRLRYVEGQHPAPENNATIYFLLGALVSLERRAARLHGRYDYISPETAEFGPFCSRCGHVGHECVEKTAA